MAPAESAVARAVLRCLPADADGTVLVRAPGRVNLLGEHTDYNGLPVLPMAIDRAVWVAARRLPGARVRARNLDQTFGSRTFAAAPPLRRSPLGDWANYLKAVVQALALPGAGGLELVVGSDLPAGAGLSSSSALVVATALAICATRGGEIDRLALAERLAAAERYVGTLSGGMDQAVILLAEAGRALHVDFFPLRARPVALPGGHAVVVAHSLVRAEKSREARVGYNHRVVECRLATRILAAKLGVELNHLGELRAAFPARPLPDFAALLADVLPDTPLALREVARHAGVALGALEPALRAAGGRARAHAGTETYRPVARARHVLTEAARVAAAVQGLASGGHGDPAGLLGSLMNASHESCRDAYEISVPEVDTLVDAARAAGACGARLTGAGFGGCVVSLVPATAVDAFLARLDASFYRRRLAPGDEPACHRFVFTPAAGAEVTRLAPLSAAR